MKKLLLILLMQIVFSNSDCIAALKLTYPKGGEEFVVGSDTLITWEGVAPTDSVILEYSFDNGINWELITNKAVGFQYLWKNIPRPIGTQCLLNIRRYSYDDSSEDEPDIEWQKTYGNKLTDYAHSVIQTNDQGYIVAGYYSGGTTFTEGCIHKLNSHGNKLWQMFLGGGPTGFKCIQQTSEGGSIVAGYRLPDGAEILKWDINGMVQWETIYAFKNNNNNIAQSIQQTKDGGYIVTGTTDLNGTASDCFVVKLDNYGKIEWDKIFAKELYTSGESIYQTSDGGYIVAGSTSTNRVIGYDCWLLKLDISGNKEWEKTYGTSGNSSDFARSAQQTIDGGYILAGSTETTDRQHDYLVIKLDNSGNVEWEKKLGGSYSDQASSIQQTTDGGYIVAGRSYSKDGDITKNNGDADAWIVKLNKSGEINWQKSIGGSKQENPQSIKQTLDGGYVFAGYTESNDIPGCKITGDADFYIVKLSHFDISDQVFSIVEPKPASINIDMKKCLVGKSKDSTVNNFVYNAGNYRFRVDSIYLRGADAKDFSIISNSPNKMLEPTEGKNIEFRFTPSREGIHNAEIVISMKSDIIIQSITGEGVEQKLQMLTDVLDFGQVACGNNKIFNDTVLIKNIAKSELNIDNVVQFGPDKAQFKILSGGGTFTLQPNETRKLSIEFRPTIIGPTSGGIGFEYNAFNSPSVVQLFGVGTDDGFVSIRNDSAYAGQVRRLKLVMNNVNPEIISSLAQKFTAKIRFQKTILSPLKKVDRILVNDSIYMNINGTIGNSLELAQILVIAGLGTVEKTTLDIVDFKLTDNSDNKIDFNIKTQPGTFKLLGICEEGGARLISPTGKVAIMQINPNPASDDVEINITLIEEGISTVSVFNSNGMKLQEFSLNDGIGLKTINLDIQDYANGLYFIQLQTPTVLTYQKFMKTGSIFSPK